LDTHALLIFTSACGKTLEFTDNLTILLDYAFTLEDLRRYFTFLRLCFLHSHIYFITFFIHFTFLHSKTQNKLNQYNILPEAKITTRSSINPNIVFLSIDADSLSSLKSLQREDIGISLFCASLYNDATLLHSEILNSLYWNFIFGIFLKWNLTITFQNFWR